jgi:hypothetical protein
MTNIMDFGQQRLQQQEAARQMMYQNSGYQFERRNKKTFVLDITDQGTYTGNPLMNGTEFSIPLFEPLTIDKLSDIYLDSVLTHNCLINGTNSNSAICLSIKEFNINSNCASTNSSQQLYNKILIPNENNDIDNHFTTVSHKGKKMNYVCSINPGTINHITGKITNLDGNSAYAPHVHGIKATNKLFHIKLTEGVGGFIGYGSNFTINSGVSAPALLSLVNDMTSGSTDIYFVVVSPDIPTFTAADFDTIKANGLDNTDDLSGFNGKTIEESYIRQSDAFRFIAEFVIVARE